MRIDSHAHGTPACLQEDPRGYRRRLEAQGIEAIVLIDQPETVFACAQHMGDFVIPVPLIDMNEDGPDVVQRLFDQGARGIKFFCPHYPLGDERYFPLYEAVKERDGVAVFHTGYLMHDADYSPRWRVKLDDLRCSHMDTIERWVPHLRILMSHFGNPYWEECWKVMWAHPTVYADLSGGTAILRSMLFWRETFAPNGRLLEEVMSKLCFGTDLTYFGFEGELGKYADFYDRLFDETGTPPSLREQVNRGNILALFGLA